MSHLAINTGKFPTGKYPGIRLFSFPVSREFFGGKPGKIDPFYRPYFTLFSITFLRFKVEFECCNAVELQDAVFKE